MSVYASILHSLVLLVLVSSLSSFTTILSLSPSFPRLYALNDGRAAIQPANDVHKTSNSSYNNLRDIYKKCKLTRDYRPALLSAEKILQSIQCNSTDASRMTQSMYTCLIQIFGDTNQLGKAILVLKSMDNNNILTNQHHYGALIQACRKSNQWEMALALFDRMETKRIPYNTIVFNSIISTVGDAKQMQLVVKLLHTMSVKGVDKDVITYTNAITSCEKSKDWKTAVQLYTDMENISKIKANTITLNAVLSTCVSCRQFDVAIEIYNKSIVASIYHDTVTYSIMIMMYGEMGNYCKSKEIFDFAAVDQKIVKDTGLYNAMITACEKNGMWQDAIDILDRLGNIRADSKTYCAIITCCGNAGRWVEALELFNRMDQGGVVKDRPVYNAIINVLLHAAVLEEALELSNGVNSLNKKQHGVDMAIDGSISKYLLVQAKVVYSQAFALGKLNHWLINENGGASSTVMDLHGFSVATAMLAINHVLDELKYKYQASGIGVTSDLFIITGKGNHVNSSGTRGVIRSSIESHILTNIAPTGYLSLQSVQSNQGLINIPKESINAWIINSGENDNKLY